jgi:hypothetical protein
VILDFGFWARDERSALRWLAVSAGASCQVIYLPVDRAVQLEQIGIGGRLRLMRRSRWLRWMWIAGVPVGMAELARLGYRPLTFAIRWLSFSVPPGATERRPDAWYWVAASRVLRGRDLEPALVEIWPDPGRDPAISR